MKIIGIVAVGKNLEIGKGGTLPWHYPEDLSFFKTTTTGNVIVMGFNTWLSIGRPLPNRENVVISKSRVVDNESVFTFKNVDEVLERFKGSERDIFVIGGSQTYEAFRDSIDEWLVTRIPEEIPEADTFMSSDFLDGFTKSTEEKLSEALIVERFVRTK
jgi:dihydrofolate reductase